MQAPSPSHRKAAVTGCSPRFLDDGRICLSNNAVERAMRCVAMGRKNWPFAGPGAGGHRAAAIYTLIETCKLNEVDPRAWLADVLKRLPNHPAKRIHELLPWAWGPRSRPLAQPEAPRPRIVPETQGGLRRTLTDCGPLRDMWHKSDARRHSRRSQMRFRAPIALR